MLNQYPKYKETGIDWIGKIPESWGIKKLKYVAHLKSGENITSEQLDEAGSFPVYGGNGLRGYFSKFTHNGQYILIGRQGALCGNINYASGKFWASEHAVVVTLNKENNLTYFGEVLKSMDLNRYSQSAAQPGLAVDTIMDLSVPVPPFKEQNQIAKFIEVQTSKLERIVEKDKLLIKLLKAKRTSLINQAVTRGLDPDVEKKDSGIDWFGRIPKNWLIRRLKHIADVRISNIDKKSKQNEPDVLLCNYLDVYKNEFITSKLNFMKATASPEQIRKLTLHKSDVLITKDSEEPDDIAIPALVTEDLKGVVSGYHLALITPDSNYVTGAYLFRSLQSKKINDQFVVEANGVTRFGISTYPILNSYFLLPPIHEQIRITVHLDSETKRISKTIKRIRTQIDLLEEYKKSLINNAVTGKIDVREQKWT